MAELRIRPHHLLCIPRFYRSGYSSEIRENMKRICSMIRKKPEIEIKIVEGADDICKKCPHVRGDSCRPDINRKILVQDGKVLKHLNIKENSIHKAREVFNLSIEKIGPKEIKEICEGCDYLNLCFKWGVNKSFEKDLNR